MLTVAGKMHKASSDMENKKNFMKKGKIFFPSSYFSQLGSARDVAKSISFDREQTVFGHKDCRPVFFSYLCAWIKNAASLYARYDIPLSHMRLWGTEAEAGKRR